MPATVSIFALCISLLALCVSIGTWYVHYENQRERRHGEISKLRSSLIEKLAGIEIRARSTQMHYESARSELRRLPDSDFKYERIEATPAISKGIQDVSDSIVKIRLLLERINTKTAISSGVLINLQSIEHELGALGKDVTKGEELVLEQLTLVRTLCEMTAPLALDAPRNS